MNIPIYLISEECYEMFLEEWGSVIRTRSTYYPFMLILCKNHVTGLTRDSRELFSDELKYLAFTLSGLIALKVDGEEAETEDS